MFESEIVNAFAGGLAILVLGAIALKMLAWFLTPSAEELDEAIPSSRVTFKSRQKSTQYRAEKGSRAHALLVLDQVPNVPPEPQDKIKASGHQSSQQPD